MDNIDNKITPKVESKPILEQTPHYSDKSHPVNLISYLSDELKRFRQRHPNPEARSATGFIDNVMTKYLSETVGRNRISRAEKGNLQVDFGIYAAYFSEMGIWPDIINSILYGSEPTARYLHFIKGELKSDISQGESIAKNNINKRLSRERSRQ